MNNKLKTSLFWFIFLQPFLDIYWFYYPPLSTIFRFAIPTIIRILGIIFLLGIFFSQKYNWKRLTKQRWLIAYTIILIIYSLLHLWHVKDFNSVDPSGYQYSSIGELFYLVRMALPLITIYLTYYSDFSEKKFKSVIKWLVGIFSSTIVITNLFTISLMSYEIVLEPGTHFIKGNIFNWFAKNPFNYYFLASKGLFYKANTLSAIMLLLLPLMLYIVVTEFNWKNLILYILQSLAMLELGTKVASVGLFLATIMFIGFYIFNILVTKDIKLNKKAIFSIIIVSIGSGLLFSYSPAVQRVSYDSSPTSLQTTKKSKKTTKHVNDILETGLKKYNGKAKKRFLVRFIRKYAPVYALNKNFVEKSYSYKYDPYFWLKIMNWPISQRRDYRLLERSMLDQVIKNNNNKLDKWFGISYIRENNIFKLERDFLAQKYSLGWIGMILFTGLYLVVLAYCGINWLIKKAYRNFENSVLLMSTTSLIISAFYAGNVLDFLTATFIFAFILGYLLSRIKQEKSLGKNS
ncbi:O-antigen ligase family protein [Lactobacillus mulieris]|uniref:O-antigen ligase family protein n=2 Tax=Bacilli TaxID=91061 RepID=UPI001432AB0F|nr:O-antigen ligase family protein [Lactobacillus mulieris]MCF1784170.1 O-antigen ligase family protein [Lactobacillus mulieris]MCW8104991.1 O-antigen ligase family protein [Lactobacillus mulieris]MDK6804030.1 O-antigen ligase family protein [Lactobacillus mulieris]MDK8383162.1 O-antigen ligase family protein [Lactobacillus mulieris]MDT9621367.1 O-antigen ligase family protein [Lactobacillus mulieris]